MDICHSSTPLQELVMGINHNTDTPCNGRAYFLFFSTDNYFPSRYKPKNIFHLKDDQ